MRARLPAVVCLLLCAGCTCEIPVLDSDSGAGGGQAGGGAGGGGGGGGAGGSGGGAACVAGATALELAPADSTLTVGAQPAPVAFTGTARLAAGGTSDVTARLSWTVTREDDTPPGTFTAPGTYQPQPGAGGRVTVRATDGCLTATTTLTLRLEATFRDPGAGVTARFAGPIVTGDATRGPAIAYPSDQTRFPRNLYKVLFQWKRSGNDSFRLTFEGSFSKIVVYSDGVDPQCAGSAATSGCAETLEPEWLAIAGSNAGDVATLVVDGVRAGDANVYRSAPITLGFSRRDVQGAIFYWSTTAAGVRRASVSDRDPEPYVVARPVATTLPNGGGAVKCVACHTVSRSGKRMVAYTEAATKGVYVYDVTPQAPPTQILTTQLGTARGFGTFRPDDERVVATVGNVLSEFNVDGGARVQQLPVPRGTNPDWSPSGAELMFSDQAGDSPAGANLSVIAYDGGAWGPVRTLVSAAGQSNLFPSCSPDGQYVAYSRGRGGHGDKTLQLWLVKADGTQSPVELVTANRIVGSQLTTGQHENNMPTWAPPGDLHWIAFNTVRPYGLVFPTGGTQQIWVAAIDPAKLGQRSSDGGALDPSYPAFRFAFQGLTENNHRAFWTLDVRDPADAGPSCSGLGAVCATSAQCCAMLECTTGAELINTCQPASTGACLTLGSQCDQTSGAACCSGLVCDVAADGGTVCFNTIN